MNQTRSGRAPGPTPVMCSVDTARRHLRAPSIHLGVFDVAHRNKNLLSTTFATLLLATPFAAATAHADEQGSFRVRSTLPVQVQRAQPRQASTSAPLPMMLGAGPLGDGVPAYGLEMTLSFVRQYATFDISSPVDGTRVGPDAADLTLWTATFVGNDFSKEYVLGDANILRTISTTDGTVTDIGSAVPTMDPSEYWVGMKWDPTTDKVFGVTANHNHGQPGYLYTIDPATAEVTFVAPLDNASGEILPLEIAINSEGEMYAVSIIPPYDNWLVKIDKTSGDVEPIGFTGINAAYAQGLDFDKSTDTLYWTAFGNTLGPGGGPGGMVYTIDLTDGEVTEVGPTPDGNSEVWAMAIARPARVTDRVFCSGFELGEDGTCSAAPAGE